MKLHLLPLIILVMLSTWIIIPIANADTEIGFRLGYLKFGALEDKNYNEFRESDSDGMVYGIYFEKSVLSMFALNLDLGFYQKKKEVTSLGTGDLNFKTNLIPITLNFKLKLPFPLLKPYAGVGVGYYYLNWDLKTSSDSLSLDYKDDTWGLGYQGMVGLEISFVAFGVFAEYKYSKFKVKLDLSKDIDLSDSVEVHQAVVGVFIRF